MEKEIIMPNKNNDLEIVSTIDSGSNRFHMIVARVHKGSLQRVDRLKERFV